jgi:hypothetical protein
MANMNKTTAIVMKLIQLLLKQGQILWMHGWTVTEGSPTLARGLKQHIKHCYGTLKLNKMMTKRR